MTLTEARQTLDALKPYPAYKESGVEWIGEIPDGWEIRRIKEVAPFDVGGTPPTGERHHFEGTLPWMTIADMQGDLNKGTRLQLTPEAVHLYRIPLARAGTLLMSFKLSVGKTCFAPYDLYTNEAIAIFHATDSADLRYLNYALPLATLEHAGENIYGAKILNQKLIRETPLPVPPQTTQVAIAAFLDHETARIAALMREQEQLLEDIRLKRQATINHATKAARRIDSSHLPAGWRNVTLKNLLTSFEQGWSPQCDNRPADEDEWGVMKVGCVNGNTFNAQENKALPSDLEPIRRYALQRDDVLMSRANTRDLVGSAARVDRDYPKLLLCDKLYRLRTDQAQLRPAYLVLLLDSPLARATIETAASGASSSMVNISQATVRNLVFPVPPLTEQDEIIEHLDHVLAQIDNLAAEVRANIEDMKLLRSTLITAATTGKIDVRGWKPA